MPEMPRAGERHRHPALVRRRNHLRVLHRTARLNRRRRARVRRRDQVRRETGKTRRCKPRCPRAKVSPRPPSRPRCGWSPRGSSGPRRCPASGPRRINNRVRFHMLHHAPAKQHRFNLRFGRLPFRHDFQIRRALSFSNRAAAAKTNPRRRCARPMAARRAAISTS